MAENGNAPKASETTTKQAEKVAVGGQVTIETAAYDAHHPLLLEQAADAFKSQVAERHGAKNLTNVSVTVAVHRVGTSVTYDVTGEMAG